MTAVRTLPLAKRRIDLDRLAEHQGRHVVLRGHALELRTKKAQ